MNFRVVDEHGRQLGQGRNLGALKAELGAAGAGAFQALAGLKMSKLTAPTEKNTENMLQPILKKGL
jgi:ATP-dependent helicase HrpA